MFVLILNKTLVIHNFDYLIIYLF